MTDSWAVSDCKEGDASCLHDVAVVLRCTEVGGRDMAGVKTGVTVKRAQCVLRFLWQ